MQTLLRSIPLVSNAIEFAKRLLNKWGLGQMIAGAHRPELEQSVLRVAIGGLVLIYLVVHVYRDGQVTSDEASVLWVAIGFFLLSIGLTAQILQSHSVSVARRFLGMVADNGVTSYCLIQTGEPGAVIIGVYLFITFGNGFRYGRKYLHACQVMSLIGFMLVVAMNDFWHHEMSLSIGIAISIVVLPFYVGVLAQRITEAKQRADEANQAKGRFVANVSHEMRTPLNGVIAMADVLRETRLDESQREIVDTLGTSANLLLAQIEDVLDMAKIEAGRVQIENRSFDLSKLISSTVKVVLPQARLRGLKLSTEIAPDTGRWFSGDSHHIGQVLLNLLANAVKFTERGGVLLRATIVTQDPIRFLFDVSESDYLRYQRLYMAGARPQADSSTIPVRIRLADETQWKRTGKIDFVDNLLSLRSATIRTRAVVENKDHLLTPGVFGRVQLYGGEYDALMIPDLAVVSDQARKIVFVVGNDNVVQARPVTLGQLVDGLRVVRDGLKADDKVVLDGLANPMVRPGAKIVPQKGEIVAQNQKK